MNERTIIKMKSTAINSKIPSATAATIFQLFLLSATVWKGAYSEVNEVKRTFSVDENAPINTLLGYLKDPPPTLTGGPGGQDHYLIVFPPETDVEDSLWVDRHSGEIRTRLVLDYEKKAEYVFLAIPIDGSTGIRVIISVLDQNDNAPVFPVTQINVELSEYAKIGSETPLPSATDADSGPLSVQHYRIVSGNVNNAFRLSTKRLSNVLYLDLIVNAQLDREFRVWYLLEMEALDGGTPARKASLMVNVTIIDANDNPPVFNQPRYQTQLKQNATVGQDVVRVHATDKDIGPNAAIEYRILPSPANAHSYFAINAQTGVIRLKTRLPDENRRRQNLELLIVARDRGIQPLESTAFVTINLLSSHQYLPQISLIYLSSDDGSPSVSESAQVGDFIARISVKDPESGLEYRTPVNMTISNPSSSHFGLQKTKEAVFILTLSRALDREAESEERIGLVAVDSKGRISKKNLTMTVRDVNDNIPQFTQTIYEAEVEERAGAGASVLQVMALDNDEGENGTVSYSLHSESDTADWFSIDKETGLITTLDGIDCERSSNPQLTVVAQDLGHPPLQATAKLILRILDVNDNAPLFDKSIYNVTLAEDTEIGSCFLQVSARDPDCGVNAAVRYNVEEGESPKGVFRLRENDGTLCLHGSLDYEQRTSYQFHIIAQDGGGLSSSSLIRINVEDKDDNAPIFYPQSYNVSLKEDADPPGSPILLVSATDADSGIFGSVKYSILGEDYKGLFRIHPKKGEMYIDRRAKAGRYNLEVNGVDGGGLTAHQPALITINILKPSQYNAPQFKQIPYQFTVKEDTLPGIGIGEVNADSSELVTYSIYSGDPESHFSIESATGLITIRKDLDAERFPSILLNIQASSGSPPSFNYTQVTVQILDVNDNSPVFERDEIETSVWESHPTDRPFYVVEANDNDQGESNGEVTYSIKSMKPPGPFLIRPTTGELFIVSPLDFEQETNYELKIMAKDGGIPPRSTDMVLHVNIMDSNDHAPVFDRTVFKGSVEEEAKVLTRIVQVSATDADQGHNAQISYVLLNAQESEFGVLADSGWVYVRKRLDRERQESYSLKVMGKDKGSPMLNSTTIVEITVTDVNDNAPKCSSGGPSFVIEENQQDRSMVGVVLATDPDADRNGTVMFTLQNHKDMFAIEPTGELFTRRSLDAELWSEYELSILVRDRGVPSRSSQCTIKVKVSDINDNSPFFVLPHQNKILFREEQSKGTEVIQVRATDPDSGRNGSIRYSFVAQQASSSDASFQIDPVTGVIFSGGVLDYEQLSTPLFQVTIRAQDGGTPPRSSEKEILIEVTDVDDGGVNELNAAGRGAGGDNDNYKQLQFRVSENSHVGSRIGVVDPDRERILLNQDREFNRNQVRRESLDVIFEITGGNSQEIFGIDQVSSLIYLIKPLDYETSSVHVLKISRIDQTRPGLPQVTSISVKIQVLDENDNVPIFPEDPVICTVPENATIGQLVWKLNAKDADAGANGRLVYSIIEQNPSEGVFILDPVTGQLWIERPLDYERNSEYLLVIQAEDQGVDVRNRKSARVTTRVYVTDINDNSPQFTSRNRIDVFEDEPLGYPLIHVVAKDRDWLENGRVTYQITSGNQNGYFALNDTTGALLLTKRLNRDSPRHFQLELVGKDHGRPPLSAAQIIDVHIQDVNSHAPRFRQSIYRIKVMENAYTANTPVVTVSADTSSGRQSANLRYSLPSVVQNTLFKIDVRSGDLFLTQALDREEQSQHILTVYANEGSRYDAATVIVDVGDENDHVPKLAPSSCLPIRLPENRAFPNIRRLIATDEDTGVNAQIVFSIDGGNTDGKFQINPTTGDVSCEQLDRELIGKYRLEITARDSGNPSRSTLCTLQVTVLDVNDESPKFSQSVYTAEISEDAELGQVVGQVEAVDSDFGNNAVITYSFLNHTPPVFQINPQSGIIQTIRKLDYEARKSYDILVIARDSSSSDPLESEAVFKISVLDVNDHAPVFDTVPFIANISNNIQRGQRIIRVTAMDDDGIGRNSEVTYSFRGTTPATEFLLNPSTGVISASRDLFLKSGTKYFLEVEAKDQGKPPQKAWGIVEIRVNGNPQVEFRSDIRFPQSIYETQLAENSQSGQALIECVAEKNGIPAEGVNYRIVAGDPRGAFAIESWSGKVYVGEGKLLDFEEQSEFRLIVEASFATEEHAFATVLVKLLDVNDHTPQFLQQKYATALAEGRNKGTFLLQVSAVDEDSGENSHITYSIVNGNQDNAFVVDGVGRIETGAELDTEIREAYSLTLMATDAGTPPRSSTTKVNIQVMDVNDNKPSFPPTQDIKVSEDREVGSVIGVVTANDVDRSRLLHYTLKQTNGNAAGIFDVHPFSGRVILKKPLDYETNRIHILEIEVSDELYVAKTELRVEVEDRNDNAPEFGQNFYQVSLPENTPPGASILRVSAKDPDSGSAGVVRYRLIGRVPDPPGFWIHPNTGAISMNGSLAANELRNELLQLGVEAEDGGNPPNKAVTSVQIQILSRSEQSQPKFERRAYLFVVPEDAGRHSEIGTIGVAYQGGGLIYGISSGDPEGVFRIDSTGNLLLNRLVDRERQSEYRMEISVHTKSNSVANSSASLTVQVADVNDNAPQFAEKEYTTSIGESADEGITIMQLAATDVDVGPNGDIRYEITSGNQNGYFSLDQTTGILSVGGDASLQQGKYRLIIKATDKGDQPRSSIATLVVEILDENNNGPFFPQEIYLGRVLENSNPGELALTAKATDKDGSDYGKLVYSLRDSAAGSHPPASQFFKINSVNGEVRTTVSFDYEKLDVYYFTVEATDSGGRMATVPGQVLIRGIDEFAPQFDKASYSFPVPYGAKLDEKVGVIYATDADKGADGIIRYNFEEPNDYFSINAATGVISVTDDLMPLSRSKSAIVLKQKRDNRQEQETAKRVERAITVSSDDGEGEGGRSGQWSSSSSSHDEAMLTKVVFMTVVAQSGSGHKQSNGGQKNRTTVEFRLSHNMSNGQTNAANLFDSRTITIISLVLILILILVLVFVALKLRRKKNKSGTAAGSGPYAAAQKKVPRIQKIPFEPSSSGSQSTLHKHSKYQHSDPQHGRQQNAVVDGRGLVGKGHHAATESEYQAPIPIRSSRSVRLSGQPYAEDELRHYERTTSRPDSSSYSTFLQQQQTNPSYHHQPPPQSVSNLSNKSSGRGSVIVEEDDEEIRRLTNRSVRSQQVRSMPDSGIHIFPEDNASIDSEALPSTQEYLTSLGVTAPLTHNIDHVIAGGKRDYLDGGEDGMDVQELIYSKVSEVLAEEGSGGGGPGNVVYGHHHALPPPSPIHHFSTKNTKQHHHNTQAQNPTGHQSGHGHGGQKQASGPSYQPLTHVFSEISKMKQSNIVNNHPQQHQHQQNINNSSEDRLPPPPHPDRLDLTGGHPKQQQSADQTFVGHGPLTPSPITNWMPTFTSPVNPLPPPPSHTNNNNNNNNNNNHVNNGGGPPVGIARRISRVSHSGSEREIKI